MRNEYEPRSLVPGRLDSTGTKLLCPSAASYPRTSLHLSTGKVMQPKKEALTVFSHSGVCESNWSEVILGTTSGLMFVMVIAVSYALYVLCLPYWNSISFGVLLSFVLHPKNREQGPDSNAARQKCVKRMRAMGQAWAVRSAFFGTLGSIFSLQHFFLYALNQSVLCLGLDKVSVSVLQRSSSGGKGGGSGSGGYAKDIGARKKVGNRKKSLMSTSSGRCMLRSLTVCIFCIISHLTIGIFFFLGMHIAIVFLSVVAVLLMREEVFMLVMWRVWRIAMVLFFIVALSYSLAVDVLSISDAVKRTTSAVVDMQQQWRSDRYEGKDMNVSGTAPKMADASLSFSITGLQEMVVTRLHQEVIKDLADTLNYTNATELAIAVRQVVTPIVSMFTGQITFGFIMKEGSQFHASSSAAGQDSLLKTDWVDVAQKLAERWRPFFDFATRLLHEQGSKVVDLFDSIYGFILFVLVSRYLVQLDHTILYYVVEKMLKVINPSCGEWHARRIEREITLPFVSLLQSFWHLTWFHFCITFCLFSGWSFPTPFLSGVASSLTAILPLIPKWLSPTAFAFVYTLFQVASSQGISQAATDLCVWSCFIAFLATYLDEWLLCVSHGLCVDTTSNVVDEKQNQIPTFLVGTALVLGYVSYGVRGILLGPMTIIVAKVLFDNWDVMLEPGAAAPHQQHSEPTRSKGFVRESTS